MPRNRTRKRKLVRRRGLSMIETIASMVLLAIMMTVIGHMALTRITDSAHVDAQYAILSADTFLADIYTDFHSAQDFEYVEGSAGPQLSFMMPDGLENVYSFSPITNKCYKNGVEQFTATRFRVIGATNNLNVEVKLPSERLLTLNMYR